MPGYKTHTVGGVFTFVGLFYVVQKIFLTKYAFLTAFSCFFVTILGALFPDVDTKSKGQMIFYQVLLFYLLFLLWSQKFTMFMITTCLMMLPLLVPHRGLFHRITFLSSIFIVGSLCAYLWLPIRSADIILHLGFFTVGAFSHVFLDRLQTALKVF